MLSRSPKYADDIGLPARKTVVVYGLRIGLRADTEERLRMLKSILPPGAKRTTQVAFDASYAIRAAPTRTADGISEELIGYMDGQVLVRASDHHIVLQAIERLLQLRVAEYAPSHVFIHAGVVGWNGRAVVIPGRSYSGKSTLVAAFVRAGATYYSDEFAVVDPAGRIHPYLQPIQLRDANGGSNRIDPAEFSIGAKPLATGLILITQYHERARWRPRPVSPGQGMLALLANTVSAQRAPELALSSLNRMLAGARLLKGARGEAQSMVKQLLRSGYLRR